MIGPGDKGIQSSQDYKRRLDERFSRLNVWSTVHLERHQNQDVVLRLLDMSQLYIAPFIETDCGDKDGIPTALLEAMTTGLPIVATDAGGDVIQCGRDGGLVPQRDARLWPIYCMSATRSQPKNAPWESGCGNRSSAIGCRSL